MSSEQLETKKEPKKNSQLSIVNSQLENIRSDEVQEILSLVPNWMIRWGISLIFALIAMLVFLSWFIKYPDVIAGKITLTTQTPPVKLVTKSSGQLQKIYAGEGAFVHEGDFIAVLESPLNETSILYLQETISQVEALFLSESPEAVNGVVFKDSDLVFGEMQSEYNNLKSLVKAYEDLRTNNFREGKINNLKKQIDYYQRLATISNRQFRAFEKNLLNAKQKYEADKQLYEKGVISKMEFYARETEWMRSQQELENLKKAYVHNKITIAEYEKQGQDLNYDFVEKERKLKEGIQSGTNNLKNFIRSWEQNYVLTAPFSGEVSYLSNFSQNQFIQAGTPLFAIIPENNKYVGYIQIPSQGFGKVKPEQQVHIKLDHYPYHEYGQVNGKVIEVTQMPSRDVSANQSVYLAKIALTNDLVSTYQKELEFKPEMSGTAEIVTEDLRLMQRIFSKFKKIMDR
jgi:HlyD family type I secretion membrane fusion protein